MLTGSIFGISIMQFIQLGCFVVAIVLHEVAHGWVANKMGDPTAKSLGRLSLNPMAHIDIFGTVILPIGLALMGAPVFGYAKPVPYNPRNFRDFKKGELFTALAGPATNLILGVAAALIAILISFISSQFTLDSATISGLGVVVNICYLFTLVNFALCFFNLLPIPPLDGSSIIVPFLKGEALRIFYKVQRYALPALMVVLIVMPYILRVNPIGIYIQATAGNLAGLLYAFV